MKTGLSQWIYQHRAELVQWAKSVGTDPSWVWSSADAENAWHKFGQSLRAPEELSVVYLRGRLVQWGLLPRVVDRRVPGNGKHRQAPVAEPASNHEVLCDLAAQALQRKDLPAKQRAEVALGILGGVL